MEKAKQSEPRAPENNFLQLLHTKNSKDEDEFVEDKIPKGVLHGLALGHAQLSKNSTLDAFAQEHQYAVGHVYQRLENSMKESLIWDLIKVRRQKYFYKRRYSTSSLLFSRHLNQVHGTDGY
jgi:hypothetical protein